MPNDSNYKFYLLNKYEGRNLSINANSHLKEFFILKWYPIIIQRMKNSRYKQYVNSFFFYSLFHSSFVKTE